MSSSFASPLLLPHLIVYLWYTPIHSPFSLCFLLKYSSSSLAWSNSRQARWAVKAQVSGYRASGPWLTQPCTELNEKEGDMMGHVLGREVNVLAMAETYFPTKNF